MSISSILPLRGVNGYRPRTVMNMLIKSPNYDIKKLIVDFEEIALDYVRW